MKSFSAFCLLLAVLLTFCACAPMELPTGVDDDTETEVPQRYDELPMLVTFCPAIGTLKTEDIASVRLECGYVGVNPQTAVPDVSQSTDERDIEAILSYLQTAKLNRADYTVCGGHYEEVSFLTKDGETVTVTITNGFYNGGEAPLSFAFLGYDKENLQINYGE